MCIYLCQVRIHGITFVGAMMSNVASNFAATLAACRFTLLASLLCRRNSAAAFAVAFRWPMWHQDTPKHVQMNSLCVVPICVSPLSTRFQHAVSHLCRLCGVISLLSRNARLNGQCLREVRAYSHGALKQRMSINPLSRCLSHAHN